MPTRMIPAQGSAMSAPQPQHSAVPTTRNLLARHIVMFYGLIALVVAKWFYYGEAGRAIVRLLFIDLPATLIVLYTLPLAVLIVSVVRRKRIVGRTKRDVAGQTDAPEKARLRRSSRAVAGPGWRLT